MNNYEQLIDKLAAKLSVPAAHLWAILVRQAHVEAWLATFWVVFCVAVIVAFIGFHPRFKAWSERRDADGYREHEEEVYFIYCLVGGLASLACTIAIIINANLLIGYFLNPEYYALREILSAVK